jgi:hypothetical protein
MVFILLLEFGDSFRFRARAPYFTDYPTLIIMDSLLRAMIEQDPKTSMSKFVKYNVPKFLESLTKNRKVRASR